MIITFYIISFIILILFIIFSNRLYFNLEYTKKCTFYIWMYAILILSTLIPVINIILLFIVITYLINYYLNHISEDEIYYKPGLITKFLTKKI